MDVIKLKNIEKMYKLKSKKILVPDNDEYFRCLTCGHDGFHDIRPDEYLCSLCSALYEGRMDTEER